MIQEVKTIILGGVNGNCYLLKTDVGYVLIDTGRKSKRKKLERILAEEGCRPGNLDVILITHGDFDHTGSCVYLREQYRTKIAMHRSDAGMVEHGDMFWNRQMGNKLLRKLINLTFNIERFTPDVFLDEDTDLSLYGLDAKVLYLPGHSKGSIGILSAKHDLFCGDLMTNQKEPKPTSLVDNAYELQESIKKVKHLQICTVYPGHGRPFPMSAYQENQN